MGTLAGHVVRNDLERAAQFRFHVSCWFTPHAENGGKGCFVGHQSAHVLPELLLELLNFRLQQLNLSIYVFDRPANEDAQYLALWDANGRLTYALGAKPMRIIGVGGVFPNGGMEEDRFPDFTGKTVAGVICAPATSTFQNSFTVMGIGNGQGVSGKHGLFGNAITIPKIGTGGSPNQAVVGIVMAVDVTNY